MTRQIIRRPDFAGGGVTPEEELRLDAHAKIWIARILRTEPADPVRVREAICGLYRAAKLKEPRVIVVPSPLVMALAGGVASAIWAHRTRNATRDVATYSATRDVATRNTTRDATYSATYGATDVATYSATYGATYGATDVATRDATGVATRNTTCAATYGATYGATRAATRDATADATRDATDAATVDATADATYDATYSATYGATYGATDVATRDATYSATYGATYGATDSATYGATADATRDATDAATVDATTVDATTRDATADATRDATDAATVDATTRDATADATRDATDLHWLRDFLVEVERNTGAPVASSLTSISMWSSAYAGGNMWAQYDCYLTACRDVLGLRLPEHDAYHWWEQAAIEGGFRFLHPEFCLVSDFPELIRQDEEHRPHCADGPSHRWRDGWELYHWHGVAVPREWIVGPRPSAAAVLSETNAEKRRAGAEILGWDAILAELGARTIDRDEPAIGELVEVDLPGAPGSRFVRVQCATGRWFALPVPRKMTTALEANAWTYGIAPHELRAMQVRT